VRKNLHIYILLSQPKKNESIIYVVYYKVLCNWMLILLLLVLLLLLLLLLLRARRASYVKCARCVVSVLLDGGEDVVNNKTSPIQKADDL
jgi:ABC-type transport system involved in cytochrome c biogenesis permease component